MLDEKWSEFYIELSARDRERPKKYKCFNCSKEFGFYLDIYRDGKKFATTKKEYEFCSENCKKEYKEEFKTVRVLDVQWEDLIQDNGLDIYEPVCYAVDADILREAETYEARSIYNWECFRFFVLLNKTRSGQFKNKPDGTGSLKNV
jgi:hypothetical protein